jgi:hypothetical protein
MTYQPPATTPAVTPPTTPTPQPSGKKETDWKDLGLKAIGVVLSAIAGAVGILQYNRIISQPAPQLVGSVEVHPFYVPRPFDLRRYDPSAPGPPKSEPKIDPDVAQFDYAKKQYTITVSNRGSKLAKDVRLLIPSGADFYINASRPDIPGPVTFIADAKIDLFDLEINETRKIYVWSGEPMTNAAAETITIAHDGGRKDITPQLPSTFSWWGLGLGAFGVGGILALVIATIQEVKTTRKLNAAAADLKEKITQQEELSAQARAKEAETAELNRKAVETLITTNYLFNEAVALRAEFAEAIKRFQS